MSFRCIHVFTISSEFLYCMYVYSDFLLTLYFCLKRFLQIPCYVLWSFLLNKLFNLLLYWKSSFFLFNFERFWGWHSILGWQMHFLLLVLKIFHLYHFAFFKWEISYESYLSFSLYNVTFIFGCLSDNQSPRFWAFIF